MARSTASTRQHSEELSFVQKRVAEYLFMLGAGGLAFWLFRFAVSSVQEGSPRVLLKGNIYTHLIAATIMLVGWWLCRRGARSRRFLHATDAACTVASSLAYTAMGLAMDPLMTPSETVGLICGVTFFSRAIWVPSTARRTAYLGVVIGVPMVVAVYVNYRGGTEIGTFPLDSHFHPHNAAGNAMFATAFAGLWWALITLLCSLASRVIHGLRKTVRDIQKLGQYFLEQKLGEGGMGEVHRARHAMLRRPTAIKLLRPDKAGEDNVARFEREVQLTAQLSHPNTVTVFDYGRTPEGTFYYAMEFLDGASLAEVVDIDGPQAPARVVKILREAAGALAEAHDVGLIHRDIKPGNIMLCTQGGALDVAKVLDFGLVRKLDDDGDLGVTQPGRIAGTPAYMAPEAFTDPDAVDARSDIYGLGAVGYYLLTGKPVFTGKTIVELAVQHANEHPIPPSALIADPISPALEALIIDCLRKAPADRPQSARELLRRLHEVADVGVWDGAQAWWKRHEDAIRARRAGKPITALQPTVAVDMASRDAFAPTVQVGDLSKPAGRVD